MTLRWKEKDDSNLNSNSGRKQSSNSHAGITPEVTTLHIPTWCCIRLKSNIPTRWPSRYPTATHQVWIKILQLCQDWLYLAVFWRWHYYWETLMHIFLCQWIQHLVFMHIKQNTPSICYPKPFVTWNFKAELNLSFNDKPSEEKSLPVIIVYVAKSLTFLWLWCKRH